jgi:hypothetical protein
MADKSRFSLFGFKIGKKEEDKVQVEQSFAPPTNDDGSLTISSSAFFGTAIDVDGSAKNEVELIIRYREMSLQPEVDSAIEDVVNEAIVQDDDGLITKIVLDDLKQSDKIKKAIEDEFHNILRLLNYNNMASDIFRRFYVDGRLNYHILIDINNPQKGIQELRYIDPRKIKKVREIKKKKDEVTGVEVIVGVNEFFLYNDKLSEKTSSSTYGPIGIKIAPDSIISINSGLMDTRRSMVLSYVHKAIKPLNQLRMMEDASVIYKISRAPQRRIFYVDVGNLPKIKAEQYIRDIMTKYKNKLVYDASTGEVRDDRKHLSMLEDFWMPRREGGKGTEIQTLESSDSFNDMSMVEYFEKKLYKALNVPVTRLDPQQAFSIGRTSEITRDELKFAKFIDKLRNKFSELFDQALRVQLVLKGICTEEEWNEFKEHVFFDFIKDNNFAELKEAEIMQERMGLLQIIDPYVGKYYSKNWVQRHILRLNDEDIEKMEQEISEELEIEMQKQQLAMGEQGDQIDQEQQQQQQNEPETGDGSGISGAEPKQALVNPYNPYQQR